MKKLLISQIVFVFIAVQSYGQWTLVVSTDKKVTALGRTWGTVYAGLTDSGILSSTNLTTTWSATNNGLPAIDSGCNITDLQELLYQNNNSIIFAATGGSNGSGVFYSANNGNNWIKKNNGLTNTNVTALLRGGHNQLYAASCGGGVYMLSDTSASWMPSGLDSQMVRTLARGRPYLYAAVAGKGIYRCNDTVGIWTQLSTGFDDSEILSMAAYYNNIIVCTDSNGVYKSTDWGTTWTPYNTWLKSPRIISMDTDELLNGKFLYAAGDDGEMYWTYFTGSTWYPFIYGIPGKKITSIKRYWNFMVVGVDGEGIYIGDLPELTDIQDNIRNDFSAIYPNPSCNETTIQTQKTINGNATLYVYNATGQIVTKINNITGQSFTFNHQHLPAGQYVLKLTENNTVLNQGTLIIAR